MKALLYKDWIVFRWVFLIVPVFLVLQIALLVPRVGWKLEYILGMPTVVLVVTGIFSGIGAQITDMRFQVDRYLQSAPIKKALVMLERYLWFWIIGVIASVLISVALYFWGRTDVDRITGGCWLLVCDYLFPHFTDALYLFIGAGKSLHSFSDYFYDFGIWYVNRIQLAKRCGKGATPGRSGG